MRILLIYPPISLHKYDISTPVKPPLIGLGYLGAALLKEGHQVKILDCITNSYDSSFVNSDIKRFGLSDEEIIENIKMFDPDVVGVSCMYTSYFMDAHNIARLVKLYNKDILVVFGGAHVSSFPDAVMKDNNVDVSVIGEGEVTIVELLNAYSNNKSFVGINGICHRVNGKLSKEDSRRLITDLDSIEYPAWDLLKDELKVINKENERNRYLMRKPVGYVLTSRGCPKNCYFCSVNIVWSRKWRPRSAKNVVDEIEYLMNKYNYKEFLFVDDNSSVSKSRMHEICGEIINRKLNIRLATPTGIAIDTLDEAILLKMKKAGFYRLCFGLESGDPETQEIIGKRIDLARAKVTIRKANKLGFWTSGTFIIGFPHETEKTIRATIDFMKKSNLDFAVCYLLTPQPGTQAYTILKEQGLIDLDQYINPNSSEWYKIGATYSNGFRTIHFSNKDLQDQLSKTYKTFLIHKMFSIGTYINLIRKIKGKEELVYAMRIILVPLKMVFVSFLGRKLSNVSIVDQKKELSNLDTSFK